MYTGNTSTIRLNLASKYQTVAKSIYYVYINMQKEQESNGVLQVRGNVTVTCTKYTETTLQNVQSKWMWQRYVSNVTLICTVWTETINSVYVYSGKTDYVICSINSKKVCNMYCVKEAILEFNIDIDQIQITRSANTGDNEPLVAAEVRLQSYYNFKHHRFVILCD